MAKSGNPASVGNGLLRRYVDGAVCAVDAGDETLALKARDGHRPKVHDSDDLRVDEIVGGVVFGESDRDWNISPLK